MAAIVNSSDNAGTDSKVSMYHRTLALNIDCGSDIIRELINGNLQVRGTTLQAHISDVAVQSKLKQLRRQKVLKGKQIALLNATPPDLNDMDITLLSAMALELFSFTSTIQSNIRSLRDTRNEIIHKPKTELENDLLFNDSERFIIDLAREANNDNTITEEFRKRINDLKMRELVKTRTNLELIILHGESLTVKLVETDGTEKADAFSDIMTKYRLTQWVRYLSRAVEVDILLQKLTEHAVIDEQRKNYFRQLYNYEEQMYCLVLHMLSADTEKILKFTVCLRELNSHAADLIEGRENMEKDFSKRLKLIEKEKMKDIVSSAFETKAGAYVTCEDVHIFIEEERKYPIKFDDVIDGIKEVFPDVNIKEKDSQFHGITWKDETKQCGIDQMEESEDDIADMSCDKFAEYLAANLEKVKEGIGDAIKATVLEQILSSKIFARLTIEQLEEIFSPGLESVSTRFAIGIKMTFKEIQQKIENQSTHTIHSTRCSLRKFDSPTGGINYKPEIVMPDTGSLIVPAHEFVSMSSRRCSYAFIAKCIVRFASACINGKKNGTIHFGIKDKGNGQGKIIGLSKEINVNHLRNEVQYAIKSCFDALNVERCIRPIQLVPVEENGYVLEVDIVPHACHLDKNLIQVRFPPKGNQRNKCFVFNNIDNQIVTIEDSKFQLMKNEFGSLHLEREQLEKLAPTPDKGVNSQKRRKLRKALTGGAKFVTDAFVPVICCGEITGCHDEENIRRLLAKMDVAFTSSTAVLDFDSSVSLRNLIEKDKNYFRIKLAEDYTTDRSRRDSGLPVDDCVWLYTNGNKELGKEKLTSGKWFEKRSIGVKSALDNIRQVIPRSRGLLVFLVFQKSMDYDPMLDIAREAFTSTFVNECIIIAENDDILGDWIKELHGKVNKFHEKVFVGLEWQDTISEIAHLFKPKQDCYFKFADSRGNIVEMSPKEKENFQDIELIDSGYTDRFHNLENECMSTDDVRQKRTTEESEYYKGNRVTWWNLYYCNQVCQREVYGNHKERIREALESKYGKERYEEYNIYHHPGAGGTTLGRQLLWHFSQIKHVDRVRKTYRCCIINKITKDTAEEIDRFRSYNESVDATPKPVIALIDNENEELINTLKVSLDELAYKRGSPNELFCLLIYATRVLLSHTDKRSHILEQRLSINDKVWFEKKFLDLQNAGIKVSTLFAFNVLRNSFNTSFIEETTARLMEEISKNELKLLQSLSLICSFDNDHPVPESIFDSVMDVRHTPNTLRLDQCLGKPFGLVWLQREREARRKENRETWNVHLTEAMQLFITHRLSEKFSGRCVSVISQPLANAVIRYIITEKSTTFEEIVRQLLDLVETHCRELNTMSKEFVKNVCSLFKTRVELVDDKGGTKQGRFSPLILKLEMQVDNESSDDSQKRVVRIMSRCMEVTKDPFVGQQLARYLYHTKHYEAAVNVIERSLEKLPHNSYLLDTYGQVFRSKMDQMIGISKNINLTDDETVEYIKLALNATGKFKLAQKEASSTEEDKNLNCYLMEVQTILCLLENFRRFDCFVSRENFWNFLNDPEFSINGSSFMHILHKVPEFKQFRNGEIGHGHLEQSLRNLEENQYMTRAHCLTQFTVPNNDPLLLGPRERFEYFYGSKEHTMNFEFKKGVGLKLLMKAHEKKDKPLLINRANDAFHRLQNNAYRGIQHGKILEENDLLVYLGHSIIVLSNGEKKCDNSWYRNLLKFSLKLLTIQRDKRPSSRKYIEAYLYYALLHWLLPQRHFVESHPNTLKKIIDEWEKEYMKNFNLKNRDQLFKKRPKIYFALGNGQPGDDIVDEECLRHKWRVEMSKGGRKRKEVRADNHWRHRIFESKHQRLTGIVDDRGRTIQTKISYKGNEYTLCLHTNDDCSAFSNRPVTFVLGFSWMSPIALDVRRDVSHGNGNACASTGSNHGAKPKTIKQVTTSKTSTQYTGPGKMERHKHHQDEKELKLKKYSSSPTSEMGACGTKGEDGHQATRDDRYKSKPLCTSSVGKQPMKTKTRMGTAMDDLD